MGAKAGIGGTYGAMPELETQLPIAEKDLNSAWIANMLPTQLSGSLLLHMEICTVWDKEVCDRTSAETIQFVRHWRQPKKIAQLQKQAAQLIRETKERSLIHKGGVMDTRQIDIGGN